MDIKAMRLLGKRWFRLALFGSGEAVCFGIAMLIYDMRVDDEVWFGYDYQNSPHANVFLISALILAPLSCSYNFLCAFLIILKLRQFRHHFTQKSYSLHLQLMLALLVQTTAPLLLFIMPISYVFASAFFLVRGTLTNETTKYMPVLALAMHPIINPLTTIFFIAPYRNAVLGQLNGSRREHSPTVTITVSEYL
ncbi:unnamed protein product [Bursaphelenchus okinawaensis]|uniref:G_PROTEIN_RECEP_F1_2 domain-containing protein n=1 Tax=Bursaphelenchus okinawaensis TaxID=465554 RepID=A0A811KB98_9BILA|nr:unnamed protein product [Bursaphelenchus okinawaensis]CAG9097488.1 unnamed protein product [Bursaphelenchus okinawaensis]